MSTTIPKTTGASLEDAIEQAGGPLNLLRNAPGTVDTGPLAGGEVSNWRDEQRAWRETAAFWDLSHHMLDLSVRGPDRFKVASDLIVNSLENFPVGKAKQYVAVNEDGFIIGDGILDQPDDDTLRFIGLPTVPNWVQYNIEKGDYAVTFDSDAPTAVNPLGHPEVYRFQIHGPAAAEIFEKILGGPIPEIKFFDSKPVTVANRRVRALGHNMARTQGWELIGPWSDQEAVRTAILEAGQEFGLVPGGSRSPGSAGLESGWFPAPLPAIFGRGLKSYREWLPAASFEGTSSLGGSLHADDISDYYLTVSDLGYGRLVKFDHDFVGRDAVEKSLNDSTRRKVTLQWNTEDVLKVIGTLWEKGTPAKYMEYPIISYSTFSYDSVLMGDRPVGLSHYAGYSFNERKTLSLAVVDNTVNEGDEVTVIWGEPDGGSHRPQVERHVQTEIRATVCRVPYADVYYK